MSRLLLVTPISVGSLDGPAMEAARTAVRPPTEVVAMSLDRGPGSIEDFYDEALAVPPMLDLLAREAPNFDAVVVNCFADPGVQAARDLLSIPVVGAGEASMSLAYLVAPAYGVVSVGKGSGARIRERARRFRLDGRLVWASGIDAHVLELGSDEGATARAVIQEAREALALGAEAIILGCTGLLPVARAVSVALPVPVIEPTTAALKMAESLADLGLHHVRGGIYQVPDLDKYR